MNKQEVKFEMIRNVLNTKFGWSTVSYEGKNKKEIFLSVGGKLYCLSFCSHGGLVLSHGFDFVKSISFLDELNTSEDFLLNQCREIDVKCRSLV